MKVIKTKAGKFSRCKKCCSNNGWLIQEDNKNKLVKEVFYNCGDCDYFGSSYIVLAPLDGE